MFVVRLSGPRIVFTFFTFLTVGLAAAETVRRKASAPPITSLMPLSDKNGLQTFFLAWSSPRGDEEGAEELIGSLEKDTFRTSRTESTCLISTHVKELISGIHHPTSASRTGHTG